MPSEIDERLWELDGPQTRKEVRSVLQAARSELGLDTGSVALSNVANVELIPPTETAE